ncbi:MAG: hypothetical protein IKE01_01615 [Clostridia bacterium]|nr:hypothetical protein [Clostridia bacterium]MBR2785878.1 hypothetical protein [Clostridia bacterium]
MNALKTLLAQYAGTGVVAPLAGGVKTLTAFASSISEIFILYVEIFKNIHNSALVSYFCFV